MEEKKEYPVEQSAKPSLDVNPALESNDYVAIDERKFVRKIDWRIMPLLWMGYNLQYLDKVLINFAQQMGMLEDANMTQNQYSNLALAFYCTYLGFEIPTGYLMQKLPVAKYLAVNCQFGATPHHLDCTCIR
ncbi:hypothetical protein KEM55_003076 [Ascosphaera atra]|nr:hypothetical protein KEM55_003076 [Ascosphaera atra]